MDAGGQDEEGDREDRDPGQDHERGRPAGDHVRHEDEGQGKQGRADEQRRDRPDHHRIRAEGAAGRRVEDHRVAGPAAVRGNTRAVDRGEGPRVVGVDARIRILAGRVEHLEQEAGLGRRARAAELDDRQAERDAQGDRGQETDQPRGHDPDRPIGASLPGTGPIQDRGHDAGQERAVERRRVRERPEGRRIGGSVHERATDRHDRDDRDEDRKLRLDQSRDDCEDRRSLGTVAPQLANAEEEEHDPERVDLAPQDGVEPADRVRDGEGRPDQSGPSAATQLADHRPDEPAERHVGQDRRELDQVADAAHRVPDRPDEPQDIEISGRVIVEERPLVEAVEAFAAEVAGPELERGEVDPEARAGVELCDDDSEDEAEREDGDDRADAIPRPGGPRRRVRVPTRSARLGAGRHGLDLPERALRWTAG